MEFKFKGTLSDFKKILDRLISKYPKDIKLSECLIKEYGKEEVSIC
ncbi:MAG: hypothetical protein ACFFG0_02910 [Candidatus Thorarchaeota archaeon]